MAKLSEQAMRDLGMTETQIKRALEMQSAPVVRHYAYTFNVTEDVFKTVVKAFPTIKFSRKFPPKTKEEKAKAKAEKAAKEGKSQK